jgi:hypothetical protein
VVLVAVHGSRVAVVSRQWRLTESIAVDAGPNASPR